MEPQVITVQLPRMVGNKEQVERLFEDQDVPRDLAQVKLRVVARDARYLSDSAAWELVRQATSRKAMRLIYVQFQPAWVIALMEGAEKLGVLSPGFFLIEGEP